MHGTVRINDMNSTKVVNDLFSEDFRTDPYWWDDVDQPDLGSIVPPAEADVVVIGSGYTGLSAALQTLRGGRTTVVLDAETAGWGCSTRNGGQISTSVKPGFNELSAKHGAEQAFRILKEGHDALTWLTRFIADEKIDCNFDIPGRFHAAHNPTQFARLAARIGQEPAGLETGAYLVERSDQRAELGTDTYFGGAVFPRHAALHPARFHRGLLTRVLEGGGTVVCHCPASDLSREGPAFIVQTPRGRIRAGDVVIATNGYTGALMPWLRRRVIPIGSYIIATEPIAPDLMSRLMPKNRIVGDTRKLIYYYRASPDRRRILFGGRVSHSETDPRRTAPRLHADLIEIFPELAQVRISHSWAGFVAYTFDTLAHIGRHDGAYYAMGYCGSGVSMAGYLGMRVGQRVLSRTQGQTGFDDVTFQTRPLYSGNPWFLSPMVAYYRWLDRQNR